MKRIIECKITERENLGSANANNFKHSYFNVGSVHKDENNVALRFGDLRNLEMVANFATEVRYTNGEGTIIICYLWL